MTHFRFSFPFVFAALLPSIVAPIGCRAEEGELEQHADACEALCSSTASQCATDPAFTETWQLECEVSCNLDFADEARPFETCVESAPTCAAKDACTGGFPSGTDGVAESSDGSGATVDPSATDPGEVESSGDPTGLDDSSDGGESTGDPLVGDPCCDTSGAGCSNAEIQQCVCDYLPACCTGVWDERCASVAVANGCIDGGCSTLEDQTQWSCSCSTTSVYCPDDPFVSQIIFGTDACGVTQDDALVVVTDACEHGSGGCEVTPGSCECTCERLGAGCGPV